MAMAAPQSMKEPSRSMQPSTRRISTLLDTPELMRALARVAGMFRAFIPAENTLDRAMRKHRGAALRMQRRNMGMISSGLMVW